MTRMLTPYLVVMTHNFNTFVGNSAEVDNLVLKRLPAESRGLELVECPVQLNALSGFDLCRSRCSVLWR
jgi:hypothetical protein